MTALSPAERTRLVALLGMLGSDHAGERANAGSLAAKLIRERGLTWGDLVTPVLPSGQESARQHRASGEATVQADIRFCSRYFSHLTAWEQTFVASVSGRAKLSEKQAQILRQAADKLRGRGFA